MSLRQGGGAGGFFGSVSKVGVNWSQPDEEKG